MIAASATVRPSRVVAPSTSRAPSTFTAAPKSAVPAMSIPPEPEINPVADNVEEKIAASATVRPSRVVAPSTSSAP